MKNFDKYRYFHAGNSVIAVTSYAGKTVRGVAKCNPSDTYNEETGRKLAAARCWAKVADKRYKSLMAKREQAVREFDEALNRLTKTTDYLHEANQEAAEAYANLETLEKTMKVHQD